MSRDLDPRAGLAHADPDVRARSCTELARRGALDAHGIDVARELLGSPRLIVVIAAIEALASVGDPELVPRLAALPYGDYNVRHRVTAALAAGGAAGVRVLLEQATEGAGDMRTTAIWALWGADPVAVEALREVVLRGLEADDTYVRVAAASLAERRRIGGAEVEQALLRCVGADRQEELERGTAFAALVALGSEVGIARLLEELSVGNVRVVAASRGLGRDARVEEILIARLLREEDVSVGLQLAEVLGDNGTVAAVSALERCLRDLVPRASKHQRRPAKARIPVWIARLAGLRGSGAGSTVVLDAIRADPAAEALAHAASAELARWGPRAWRDHPDGPETLAVLRDRLAEREVVVPTATLARMIPMLRSEP